MSMLNELIDINYGPTGGDCTCAYYITRKKDFTVDDFIRAVISNPREWGTIRIKDVGEVQYKYGEIFITNLTPDVLTSKVVNVSGRGGWSNSDYMLSIKRKKKFWWNKR